MIIVTGANGFIGQHLIPQLLKKNPRQEIISIIGKTDKLHEKIGFEKIKKNGLKYLIVDLLDLKQLSKIPKNADVVIHLASAVDTGSNDFRVNSLGTKNLLKGLNKIDSKTHIIYTSTAAVWSGRSKFNILTEQVDPIANNEYGRTKLIGEEILKKDCLKKGYALTILRLNTVYGKDLRQDKLFGMIQKMVENNSAIVRLNWPGKFGVVHVDDVCKAIVAVINNPPKPKEIRTFIVSSENVNLPMVSQLIHKKIEKKYQPILLPHIVWKIIKLISKLVLNFEVFLPAWLYNMFWRSSLVINDVLKANGNKIEKEIKKWERKKLSKFIGDTIISKIPMKYEKK